MCDLLSGTKVAGSPNSFFMDQFYSEWASYWRVSTDAWENLQEFDHPYLDAALLEGTGNTEVFGMRVQWESLQKLIRRLGQLYPDGENDRELFCRSFGTKHFVHLSRTNKLAQAVSLLRAEQSGLWHINSDGTERERLKKGSLPKYNYDAIRELIVMLEQYDAAWISWFIEQKINPIIVKYEDLSAAPSRAISEVLFAMDIDLPDSKSISPKTAKLSGNESDNWIKRYQAEKRITECN